MITRITLTLLVTTIACFLYKDTLMNVIRKPIDEVWVTKQESLLPEELDLNLEKWEKALAYALRVPRAGCLRQQDPRRLVVNHR